jgi:uncharacterized protein YndB with AHSA1/START domain
MGVAGRVACLVVLLIAFPAVAGEERGSTVTASQLTVKTGTWWYAMTPADGKPVGFARLSVAETDGGGVEIDWELRMAFPGSTYEEERTMTLDADRRLVAAGYLEGKTRRVEGRRKEGDVFEILVRTPPDAEPERTERELPADAMTGMGFVLAAWLPQDPGATIVRADVNDARGFEPEGSVVIKCVESEVLEEEGDGQTFTFRYELRRLDGRRLPMWVNRERVIVRADWGGMIMSIADASAKDLFRPRPPAVDVVPSGPEKLVVRGEYANLSPAAMFRLWTSAEQITRWWSPKAEIEPEVGGKFHLSWPDAGWFLRGEITVIEEAKRLGFSWAWHHEKEGAPAREVLVEFGPREGGGCVLTITHGPYGEGEKEEKEREGHLEGWRHVGSKLAALPEAIGEEGER